MSEFVQWFRQQPFSTKWITLFSFVLPVAIKLTILPPYLLVFHWPSIWSKLQIWRLLTPFFITRVDFSYILSLYFRFQYSFYLETIQFAGRPADYAYFLILSVLLVNIINVYLQLAVLWEALSMAIVYVWAQYNKAVTAVYLPLVMAGMDLIFGGNFYATLMGIGVGHCYYFLKEIYSRTDPSVLRYLESPRLLRDLIPAYVSATSQSFSGFTVQKPREPAHASNTQSTSKASFSPFSGTSNKIGS